MILECPNCEISYEIPVELPPEGRKVRCASCHHVWTATAPETPPQAEPEPEPAGLPDFEEDEIIYKDSEDEAAETPEAPAETEAEADIADEPPEPEPEPETIEADSEGDEPKAATEAESTTESEDEFSEKAMEKAFSTAVEASDAAPVEEGSGPDDAGPDEKSDEEAEGPPIVIGKGRKFRGPIAVNLAAGWAGLAIILASLTGIAYFQRINVVRALPGAASAYEGIGLPVNVRGIEFEKVKYSWETSAGRPVLEVFGDIVNVTSEPVKVPTIVFGLRTKEKVEVYQWAADVRSELLPAGERTAFSAQIPTPPKSIRDVQVRFAKVR